MNRKADRLRCIAMPVASSHGFATVKSRSFSLNPPTAEPGPLAHRLGEVAIMPSAGAQASVIQARRAESPADKTGGETDDAPAPPDHGIVFGDHASAGHGPIQRTATSVGESPVTTFEPRSNDTGLPDHLKAGIEQLSGFDMNDVRVHFNSSRPARLQALAYTQGTDIHVAPGQARHLPHEAWHVAQQKQGRVQPTFQLKGEKVNYDQRLEHEADAMGERAIQAGSAASETQRKADQSPSGSGSSLQAWNGQPSGQAHFESEPNGTVGAAHELTHILQQTSGRQHNPRIQRVADPKTAPNVHKAIVTEGTANWGVYILEDDNETVAVKFSKEDARRAVFADRVLTAAGLANTNARVASLTESDAIIKNITRIGQRYEAEGTSEQKTIAVNIKNHIGGATKAVSVLIMEKAKGTDFFDVLNDLNSDKSFLASPIFYRQLGRMVAADAFLGNSDRLAAVRPYHKNQKDPWGMVNSKNFKVTAGGIINTLDSDTQVAGWPLLRRLGKIITPEEWARFLIGGGVQHVGTNAGRATERVTPDLESLFDKNKRELMFNELVGVIANSKGGAQYTVKFDTFDASFQAGIAEALKGILGNMDALLLEAADLGGDDAGGGYIDPEALKYKGLYLRERFYDRDSVLAEHAESRMVFRMKTKAMLAFPDEFKKVPTVYTEDTLAKKALRGMTQDSETKKLAKDLKDRARKGVDALSLKKDEEELGNMISQKGLSFEGDKNPDRRVYKAMFESKLARFLLHLQESDRALVQLRGVQLRGHKQWPGTSEWLQGIKFLDKLKSNYEEITSKWISKLERLKNQDRVKQLKHALTSLLETAKQMQTPS